MRVNLLLTTAAAFALGSLCTGCDKLGIGQDASVPDGAPSEQELQKISYMSAKQTGEKGRRVYDHLEQAKSCADLELAMRWNRPPNVPGGAFHQKMVYLDSALPPDLAKNTEVFFSGKVEAFAPMPDGGAGWRLRMPDGKPAQAVEMASFWEKQEQESQDTKPAALIQPNRPGRMLCGQGVYQGLTGEDPGHNGKIPVIAALYAMDRDR
jgi:hypothetical protein